MAPKLGGYRRSRKRLLRFAKCYFTYNGRKCVSNANNGHDVHYCPVEPK
jgi:hypothetical protein